MSYQQNENQLPLSVVVLEVLRLRIDNLVPLLPVAMEKLSEVNENKIHQNKRIGRWFTHWLLVTEYKGQVFDFDSRSFKIKDLTLLVHAELH